MRRHFVAKQTGASARLTPGEKIRANIFGGEEVEMWFLRVNESLGLTLDYDQKQGYERIACIKTAFEEFQTIDEDKYKEAPGLLLAAWNGDPDSLRAANVRGMCRFVALYHGEYNPKRMVTQLRKVDPLTIYREGCAHHFYVADGYSGGSLDRLSRSQTNVLYLIVNNNVAFSSIQESFDASTAQGRVVVGILSVFAQFERENIYERTRADVPQNLPETDRIAAPFAGKTDVTTSGKEGLILCGAKWRFAA